MTILNVPRGTLIFKKEFFMIDYNIDLIKNVIDYNKQRYYAFKNQTEFR